MTILFDFDGGAAFFFGDSNISPLPLSTTGIWVPPVVVRSKLALSWPPFPSVQLLKVRLLLHGDYPCFRSRIHQLGLNIIRQPYLFPKLFGRCRDVPVGWTRSSSLATKLLRPGTGFSTSTFTIPKSENSTPATMSSCMSSVECIDARLAKEFRTWGYF